MGGEQHVGASWSLARVLATMGAERSLVVVFFSLVPFWMELRRAFRSAPGVIA